MQTTALRALEFDRIVDAVRGLALTPMGEARLAALAPSTERDEVARALAATSETVRFIVAHGVFAIRGSADLPGIAEALAVDGRALDAPRLLTLATFLDSVEDVRAAVQRVAGQFPIVVRAAAGATSFKNEIAETRRAIDP